MQPLLHVEKSDSPPRPAVNHSSFSWTKLWILLASFLSLALVSYLDYITGSEFLFYVFYFIPVCLCAWFIGFRFTVASALLSSVSWFVVDLLCGHSYPNELIRYWNAFICLIAFAAIGLFLYRLRLALNAQKLAQQELEKVLEDYRRSSEQIRKLQSELQVVCAWTNRIRVNGQWIPLEKFLSDNLHLSISHGISPEALEKLKNSLDQERPT